MIHIPLTGFTLLTMRRSAPVRISPGGPTGSPFSRLTETAGYIGRGRWRASLLRRPKRSGRVIRATGRRKMSAAVAIDAAARCPHTKTQARALQTIPPCNRHRHRASRRSGHLGQSQTLLLQPAAIRNISLSARCNATMHSICYGLGVQGRRRLRALASGIASMGPDQKVTLQAWLSGTDAARGNLPRARP